MCVNCDRKQFFKKIKKKGNDNFWIAELERQLRTRNIHISGKQTKKLTF